MGIAGFAAYESAKWAVAGFSETLACEVGLLGIKVCILEPGGIRTDFANEATGSNVKLLPDYQPSVGAVIDMLNAHFGKEPSDSTRVAEIVVRLGYHDNPPLHLLIGSDAVHMMDEANTIRAAEGERWRAVSLSPDAAATGPIPDFPEN